MPPTYSGYVYMNLAEQCSDCGALVFDRMKHDAMHEKLDNPTMAVSIANTPCSKCGALMAYQYEYAHAEWHRSVDAEVREAQLSASDPQGDAA